MDEPKECALCGKEGNWRVDMLLASWYDYLNDKHDYCRSEKQWVPYCPDCTRRWKLYRDQNRSPPSDDEEVAALLNDLILDNLTGMVTQ